MRKCRFERCLRTLKIIQQPPQDTQFGCDFTQCCVIHKQSSIGRVSQLIEIVADARQVIDRLSVPYGSRRNDFAIQGCANQPIGNAEMEVTRFCSDDFLVVGGYSEA